MFKSTSTCPRLRLLHAVQLSALRGSGRRPFAGAFCLNAGRKMSIRVASGAAWPSSSKGRSLGTWVSSFLNCCTSLGASWAKQTVHFFMSFLIPFGSSSCRSCRSEITTCLFVPVSCVDHDCKGPAVTESPPFQPFTATGS